MGVPIVVCLYSGAYEFELLASEFLLYTNLISGFSCYLYIEVTSSV